MTPARIVAGVWVIVAVSNGLSFSFSIFFVPLVEEFRWSRALTAGALSLSTLIQVVLLARPPPRGLTLAEPRC